MEKFRNLKNINISDLDFDELLEEDILFKTKKKNIKQVNNAIEDKIENKENEKKFFLDKEIKTKFILEKFSEDFEKNNFEINTIFYYLWLLSLKKDLKNYKDEILTFFDKINFFLLKKWELEMNNWEFFNFINFIDLFENDLISDNFKNNFPKIIKKKSYHSFNIEELDYIFDFMEKKNFVHNDIFIKFFIEIFVKKRGTLRNKTENNLKFYLLEDNWFQEKFLYFFIDEIKKYNFDEKYKNYINKNLENIKTLKNIDEIIIEILKITCLLDDTNLTWRMSKVLYFKWLKQKDKFDFNFFDICFEKFENDIKEFKAPYIINTIIWLQKVPKEKIKNKYKEIIEKSILNKINEISVNNSRNILFYLKSINLELDKNIIEKLFKIIENTDIKDLNKVPETDINTILLEKNILIISIIQVYSLYWRKIPENLSKKYFTESIRDDSIKNNSTLERKFYKELKDIYEEIELWYYFNWFEMDIFIPEIWLNIEIDWEHHNEAIKIIKDSVRDNYIENKWIKILRVKANNKKVKNLIKKLKQIKD